MWQLQPLMPPPHSNGMKAQTGNLIKPYASSTCINLSSVQLVSLEIRCIIFVDIIEEFTHSHFNVTISKINTKPYILTVARRNTGRHDDARHHHTYDEIHTHTDDAIINYPL